jgi:hypothetical protein
VIGESGLERRLARRVLAQARGHDVAHDALVDDCGIDPRAADRFAHYQRPELGRGKALQDSEEFSRRRSNGADDD